MGGHANGHAHAPAGRLAEGVSAGATNESQIRGAFAELRRQRDEAQERAVHLMAEVAGLRAQLAAEAEAALRAMRERDEAMARLDVAGADDGDGSPPDITPTTDAPDSAVR